MENNKIQWEVGDVAICVNTGMLPGNTDAKGLPALRKDYEYIVHRLHRCECGVISLDVGLPDKGKGTTCTCGAKSSPNTGIHWCNSIRFVKKRTMKQVSKELNEAIDDEEFKLAQNLQDELDKMQKDEKVS